MNAKKIAQFGLLTAMALILSYVDYLIPPLLTGAPGIKLGLGNTVLLYALYLMDAQSAGLLMLLKVGLTTVLFGNMAAGIYSLAGGVLSLIAMLLARKLKGLSILGVSVLGAVFHNVGQMLAASLSTSTRALMGYLPVLLVAAVVTGLVTGLVARLVLIALSHTDRGIQKKLSETDLAPGKSRNRR